MGGKVLNFSLLIKISSLFRYMAEEVGFEPTVDFHLRRFSRPVHSTTLPLLRRRPSNRSLMILKEQRSERF